MINFYPNNLETEDQKKFLEDFANLSDEDKKKFLETLSVEERDAFIRLQNELKE